MQLREREKNTIRKNNKRLSLLRPIQIFEFKFRWILFPLICRRLFVVVFCVYVLCTLGIKRCMDHSILLYDRAKLLFLLFFLIAVLRAAFFSLLVYDYINAREYNNNKNSTMISCSTSKWSAQSPNPNEMISYTYVYRTLTQNTARIKFISVLLYFIIVVNTIAPI